MQKHIRKPISILLSLVMVLSLMFTAAVSVFAEETWVQVPTSDEGLQAGDYYFDLSGLDIYKPLLAAQTLYDIIPENNEYRVGCTYLKDTHPDEWADAVQQIKDEYPGLSDIVFTEGEGGWPLYYAEDVLFETLQAQGIDVSHAAVEALGKAYVSVKYPEAVAQANTAAQEQIDLLKSLDWFVDLSFSGYDWIMAEQNGAPYEEYYDREMIEEFFTVYGADWKEIKIVENTDALEDGDYYIDQAVLYTMIEEMFVERYGDMEEIPMYDYETGDITYLTKAEYIAQQMEALGDFYINTAAPEDNLFRYKNTYTYSHPGAGDSITMEIFFPLADHTWGSTPVDTAFFEENVKQYVHTHVYGEPTWQWEDETLARATFVCEKGDSKLSVSASGSDITNEVITEATAAEEGLMRYTATVEFEGNPYTSTYDKAIPATGGSDEPDTPVTPDTPSQPDEGRVCPYCGEVHNIKTFSGFFVSFLHDILYVIGRLVTFWQYM